MHLEKWRNTVFQRKWIWATILWPSSTSTWSCSEPKGTNTSPASLCSCVCECFFPLSLAMFVSFSVTLAPAGLSRLCILPTLTCLSLALELWHWSFGTEHDETWFYFSLSTEHHPGPQVVGFRMFCSTAVFKEDAQVVWYWPCVMLQCQLANNTYSPKTFFHSHEALAEC